MASARRTTLAGIGAVLALIVSTGVASAVPTSSTGPRVARSLSGTPGDDVLVGTPGADSIYGLGGDDVLIGMQGDDVLVGGFGDDRLIGGPGDDVLIGGGDRDFLNGGEGADDLYASDGVRDVVIGAAGMDEAWGDPEDRIAAEAVAAIAKRIFFDRGSLDWDVWSMAPNGTGQVNLTNDPSVLSRNPTISPLGTKIAFERQSGSGDYDIWVMNIDGTSPASLLWNSSNHDLDAAWSPDGSKIAFSSAGEIYVGNADGNGTPIRLTNNVGIIDASPTWAPDGSKIAFSSGPYEFTTDFDIWVVNADGTGLAALTTDTTNDDGYPDWSPDGSTIVWTRFEVVSAGTTPKSWLWAMNADGTVSHQFAPSLTLEKQIAPGWCPDGLRIAFAGSPMTTVGTDIYTVGSTGTGLIQLTTTTSSEDDFFPDCGG